MARIKIKGRIVRIINSTTVVINLGSEKGVDSESRFYVLGEAEDVIDPETGEVLGSVTVTKVVLKASQVFERFTIAVSKWQEYGSGLTTFITEKVSRGSELKVEQNEIKPWLSKSEATVRVGDEVEVEVINDSETASDSSSASD